jgi:DNA-binding NtrC family response regulator
MPPRPATTRKVAAWKIQGVAPMMIGQSQPLRDLLGLLRRFASCDVPVLLEGETGTGKELAAREIHYASARARMPFVPINCGALQDSLIESELFGHCRGAFTDAKNAYAGLVACAEGGALFLDEVDALSPKAQVTLLRFLQNSEYRPIGGSSVQTADIRIIAATNASLHDLAAEGRFRCDLLYRLNSLYARLPPLRERGDDIVLLAENFLRVASRRLNNEPKRWSADALRVLSAHAWPGNVRELENVVLRACLAADGEQVSRADLAVVEPSMGDACAIAEPCSIADPNFAAAKGRAINVFERGYLTALMRQTSGNVSEAARVSGTERRHLGKLLKKHGIGREGFRSV